MSVEDRARNGWWTKLGASWAAALRVGACAGAAAFLRGGGSLLVGSAILTLAPLLVLAEKRRGATRAGPMVAAYALSLWFGIYFAGERAGLSATARLLLCAGMLAAFLVRDGGAAWRRRMG